MSEEKKYVYSKSTRRRIAKRRSIIGPKGVDKQRTRHARSRIKAVAKGALKGDIPTAIHKADTIETIKRVGEYKKARKQRDYKPPNHGRRKK